LAEQLLAAHCETEKEDFMAFTHSFSPAKMEELVENVFQPDGLAA
jgi:hypothetical protein